MSSLGASHRDRTRATRGYPGLATSDYIQLCRRTDRAGPARTSIPTVGCRPKYGPGIATQLERPGAGAFGGTTRGDPLVSIVTGWGRLFAACSLSSLPLHWSEAGIIRLAATEDPGYAARRRLQCWLCCVTGCDASSAYDTSGLLAPKQQTTYDRRPAWTAKRQVPAQVCARGGKREKGALSLGRRYAQQAGTAARTGTSVWRPLGDHLATTWDPRHSRGPWPPPCMCLVWLGMLAKTNNLVLLSRHTGTHGTHGI